MRTSEFYYELPPALIAQHPPARRHHSRLLIVDGVADRLADSLWDELPTLLRPGDLLIFNDTRVMPARLYGHKDSGGRVEVLIERLLDERHGVAHIRASKAPGPGTCIQLEAGTTAWVVERRDSMYVLSFDGRIPLPHLLDQYGQVPLPPYIRRSPEESDRERYQTVFARRSGSVAAPTAGLHFDEALLAQLHAYGVEFGYVTLHVGSGTFQPVRSEDLEGHHMHAERVEVSPAVCAQVRQARARGSRVIAVGTTSVRALETASQSGGLRPYRGDTSLFIYPGYDFVSVDAMITNFHLPESTLLMLVCAFAGKNRILAAYRHAVEQYYRFLSYGDAMFIIPPCGKSRVNSPEGESRKSV